MHLCPSPPRAVTGSDTAYSQSGEISWNFRNFWMMLKNTSSFSCFAKCKNRDFLLFLSDWLRVAYSNPWKIWNISQPREISWNFSLNFPIVHFFLTFHATLLTIPYQKPIQYNQRKLDNAWLPIRSFSRTGQDLNLVIFVCVCKHGARCVIWSFATRMRAARHYRRSSDVRTYPDFHVDPVSQINPCSQGLMEEIEIRPYTGGATLFRPAHSGSS